MSECVVGSMGLLRVISSFEVWILVFIVSWGGFVDVGFKVFLMRRMVTRGEAFYNGVFLNKLARDVNVKVSLCTMRKITILSR